MRDELAKIIADVMKRDLVIEHLTRALDGEKREKTGMAMTIDSLERHLKICEKAHTRRRTAARLRSRRRRVLQKGASRLNGLKERPARLRTDRIVLGL